MGGSCVICGYNKCTGSMALHHLDPSKKDFALGALRANPKNWNLLVVEIRKCVLVCNNCHGEIHFGNAIVPNNAPRFNEKFADYKNLLVEEGGTKITEKFSPCPICKNLKLDYKKYCSAACSSRSRYKVDWDNIDLATEIKTKSNIQISEEIGCSDAAVYKRLKKLGLKGKFSHSK